MVVQHAHTRKTYVELWYKDFAFRAPLFCPRRTVKIRLGYRLQNEDDDSNDANIVAQRQSTLTEMNVSRLPLMTRYSLALNWKEREHEGRQRGAYGVFLSRSKLAYCFRNTFRAEFSAYLDVRYIDRNVIINVVADAGGHPSAYFVLQQNKLFSIIG